MNEYTRTNIPENPTAMVTQEMDTHPEIIHMVGYTLHDHTMECHTPDTIEMTTDMVEIDKDIIEADRTSTTHIHSTLGTECTLTTVHEATTMAMARKIGDIQCIRCIEVNLHKEDRMM
mmetsp:Transcript_16009/g.37091  ORF Transcript_16009/g.37091 Transcript_16009/m.37091 type:complete len:118 (+) Transcript_16009:1320-1673(+)